MRLSRLLLTILALSTSCVCSAGDLGMQAQWLWSSRYPLPDESVRLRREFTVESSHEKVSLLALADDSAKVLIDGKVVAQLNSSPAVFTKAELAALPVGKHRIEIQAINRSGAAGVWLQLDLVNSAGTSPRVVTDGDWEVHARARCLAAVLSEETISTYS